MEEERELFPDSQVLWRSRQMGSNMTFSFSAICLFIYFLLFFPQALNFLFCIGVQPVNNVVVVSGEQQRDSAIHICELSRSVVSDSLGPHGL